MITGNAGDGKTAFIQRLEEEAERDPATSHFSRLPSGNGTHFVYNGRQFFTNYDGFQDEGDVGNDEVLDSFFQPYSGSGPFRVSDRTHLIAINEGRLIDFLQTRRADYPYLHRKVQDFFEQELLPDRDLLIVNSNLRAVIADGIDGLSIFDQMVANLAAPEMWEKCQSCDIVNRCYAKFNVESLNDINYGPQIRHRLKTLFQIIHFRQRLHITIRDLDLLYHTSCSTLTTVTLFIPYCRILIGKVSICHASTTTLLSHFALSNLRMFHKTDYCAF